MPQEKIHFEAGGLARKESQEHRFWQEVDENLLPDTLEGTTFKIPYEPISVRQLVTRAEFAKELNLESDPYQYVGRKISRKSFRHPLSQKEYVVIKSNRGNSPQLFFSYEGEGARHPLTLEQRFTPEEIKSEQVSRLHALIQEERLVQLSRIRAGTNVKRKEYLTHRYLGYEHGSPSVKMIYHEEAEKESWEKEGIDYVTRGVIIRRETPGREGGFVAFCKLQSREWQNDTMFVAAEYRDGKFIRALELKIPLRDLPVFEEVLQENPSAVFEALHLSSNKRPAFEIALEPGKKVSVVFPQTIEPGEMVSALGHEESLPLALALKTEGLEHKIEEQEGVRIDPEVDPDLNRVLRDLKEAFSKALLEVYLYGSIPRGYKHLQSDIDVLAIIEDKEKLVHQVPGLAMEPGFRQGRLAHGALGSYASRSDLFPFRGVEVHTIHKKKWEKPSGLRLGEFLRNARDGCILIYKKEN